MSLSAMRRFFLAPFLLLAMTANAGNFFPPEYKQFPFKEGDLLVSTRADGKFAVNRVLAVDRFDFKKNAVINIQGQDFSASEDDHLLVVGAAYGENEFTSFEQARAAALAGKWTRKIRHAPNRAPGAAAGQTLVGHQPVAASELEGYRVWRAAFEKGEAGIF